MPINAHELFHELRICGGSEEQIGKFFDFAFALRSPCTIFLFIALQRMGFFSVFVFSNRHSVRAYPGFVFSSPPFLGRGERLQLLPNSNTPELLIPTVCFYSNNFGKS